MALTILPARSTHLLRWEEALRAGPLILGGKALGLARLQADGFRVPPWFGVAATAFRSHLCDTGAQEEVEATLSSLARLAAGRPETRAAIAAASERMRALIDDAPMDDDLRDAVAGGIVGLGGGPFAVRSSAIDEDGDAHSFAGQLDTVLGADDADAVCRAIVRCWSSAFGERVLEYRHRRGLLAGAPEIAVVVQRLVVGEASGVLFTVDPVTGDPSRLRVSACLGLGEGVVNGDEAVNEYVLDHTGRVVESHIACGFVLGPGALQDLTSVGLDIARAQGGPRDIEWTMAEGELWILQARPVTTVARAAAPTEQVIWDNSNIQESYCGVTTPLTFSFAAAAYASVYEQTMRAVGLPERVIAQHRPMLAQLLGLIRGRVYYNLNNWYRGLLLLPAFRRNKADMERMMGVDEPVDFVSDESVGLLERMRRLPVLARTLTGLLKRFATVDRDTDRFLDRFDERLCAIDRPSLSGRPLGELMEILSTLRRECIDQWTAPIINDFRVMMTVGRLRRIVDRANPGDADRVTQTLLGGADVAVSAAPALLMLRMADAARRSPDALEALRTLDGAAALDRAAAVSADFNAARSELVRDYGDRCMGELKLESRPLRDDPAFVLQMLRNYLDAPPVDPTALVARARAERLEVEREVMQSVSGRVLGRWRLRRALGAARRAIRAREQVRLARTRLFGVHRDVYRAIGERLRERGHLRSADDILYLTVGEIEAHWRGTAVSADLAHLALARRREFAAYESLPAPNRIVTTGSPYDAETASALHTARTRSSGAPDRVMRGLGCSAGIAEGRVRIVTGPSPDLSLAGDVLVATRTDPGWAPLFPSACAIVVERGSVLSHSAVLARELGLPAVVAIPGLMHLLRDGERVRVNGTAGTIERLDAQ